MRLAIEGQELEERLYSAAVDREEESVALNLDGLGLGSRAESCASPNKKRSPSRQDKIDFKTTLLVYQRRQNYVALHL